MTKWFEEELDDGERSRVRNYVSANIEQLFKTKVERVFPFEEAEQAIEFYQ